MSIISLLLIGAFIGQSRWGKEVLHLTVEKVADKADAKVSVVEAKAETKVTIAEDRMSYQKNAATKAEAELVNAKEEAEKAKAGKAKAELDAAKAETDRVKDENQKLEKKLAEMERRFSSVQVVGPICVAQAPAPVVTVTPEVVVVPKETSTTIHLASDLPASNYSRTGTERSLAVEFAEYARKARLDEKLHPKYASQIEVTAQVYDKVVASQKLSSQEVQKLVQSRDGFPKGSRDYTNFGRAIARNNSL